MKNLYTQKNKNYNFGGSTSKLVVRLLVISYLLFIIVPTISSAATVKSVGNSGLVGYWTFDEGAGSKVNDMSGNRNTAATTSSSLVWSAGKIGKAVSFNGATYVSGNGSALPNVGTGGNITVSAWIKPNTVVGQGTIFSKGASGSCFNYGMTISGTGLRGRNSSNDHALGGTIVANQWQHVAVVYSASGMEGFVNGVSVGTSVNTTTTCVNNNWVIGTRAYNAATSEFFNGLIDDVRVYNRVLTASEIKTLYQFGTAQIKSVQKSGLVGYWPMNEGVGSKVNDMSGNKNTGTLAGATLPSWINGRLGKALFFDGATSKVSLGSLNISTTVTISAWVRMSTSGEVPVLSNRSGGSGVVYFGAVGGKFFVYDNGATPAAGMTSNASINTNTWKHVVWTSDGTTSNMYINGVLDKTQAHARTGGIANGNIGWDLANNVEYFPGYIDDVRVYNRVLSATEIQQLYKQNATQVNASTNNFLNNGLIYVFSLNGGDISWGSNTAYDRSGQGNNATLVSFSTTSSPATGKLGQGLKFNGVSTYLNTPAMAFLGQASATFSVSVWVKPRVVGGTIIHNMNESVGWSTGLIGFHLGKLSYNIYANGFADSPNTAVAGRWLLVSFTRDGVTGVNKLYENGVLVKTTTTGYSPSGGSHKFTLGRFVADCCQMDSPGWFDGVMDDYRLYNRVLSESEIKQIYNMAR